MENLQSGEGSSSKDASGESSESTLQLNIKTLDSRIFSFQVDKNIAVSEFKEKIAIEIGIPVGQQRLIFRGKVLKDDHVLSAYNVENGDTLHVVERQPQPPPGSNSGEATSRHDSAAGGPRNHIGHIAHSVVLGTLNVGDAGEAGVPDLSRVIGAVLNSVGLSNLAGGVQPGIPTSQANETGGSQVNAGSQSQSGDQQVPSQGIRGQSAFYPMQTPTGATIAIPSLNAPIPDSLNTLTGFMNQMESVLSQNGGQQDQPPTASSNPPSTELPRNSRGYPTVEALTIVLQQAQQLLRDHVVQALSHTASRLEEERESNDPSVRGQIHTESMRLGIAMQHLGALLLELGRTILTLRLGLTPNESFVNAGPAVYISPLGPNPIMVQPFPLQTSPLFGGLSGVAMNPMPMGTLGIGSVPRNINIHINTRGSLPLPTMGDRVNNGEDTREGRANGADSGDSGQDRVSSGVNVTASAVPSRPAIVPTSGEDAIVAEINSLLRGTVSRQNVNHAPSEGLVAQQRNLSSGSVGETSQNLPHVTISNNQKGDLNNKSSTSENSETLNELARSNRSNDDSEGSSGGPLGLGLGGLQPKRRGKQPRGQDKKDESIAVGQHVLQSLASLPTRGNANPPSSTARQNANPPSSTARQNADGPVDVMGAMSHVLGSPSLDGLLAGVSQQTGVGSPDMLRNMLQQFTQNPAMMNTVNQIAQQVDSHDLGSMFSGLDNTGQGGGFDLSRMMQQMMPIVSQALGGGSSISQLNRPSESMRLETSSRRDITPMNDDPQIDLRPVVQRLEDQSPSEDIFESLAVRAMNLSSNGDEDEDERVLDELCSQDGLAQEFMDMLRLDISRRIQDEMGS